MNKSKITTGIAIATSVLITGCSGITNTQKWDDIKNSAEYQSSDNFDRNVEIMRPKENKSDHVKDEFFVSYTTLDIIKNNRNNLPKMFYEKTSVKNEEGVKKSDVPEILYKDFGLIVEYVKQKKQSTDDSSSSEGEISAELLAATGVSDQTSTVNDLFSSDNTSSNDDNEEKINYDYSGDLKGLLDYITVSMDQKWEYDNETGKVYIYKYNTETFALIQTKENIRKSTSVSTNNGGGDVADGGGTSGTTQSIEFNTELNFWEDMQKNIENMLSEDATSSFDPTDGTIVITDSDYVLSSVRKYIDKLNENASKQVAIDVQILNVKLNDSSEFGINWNAINQTISNSILGSNIQAGFDIGNTANNLGNTLSIANNATGMNALFHALNEFSTFKTESNVSSITMNNKPVPMQVTTDISYIESITTEDATDNTGASTSTEIGVVKEGITMTVTPKVNKQNIVLEYSVNLSVLDRLESVGTQGIQTPVVSSKNFTQRIIAKNGQPMIVAAFSKENANSGKKSPFGNNLWFLGGNEEASKNSERILIVVTPYILSN